MVASEQKARHCALMMGVLTGDMPDVDLIWASQDDDQHRRCFGQGANCDEFNCPWRDQCTSLETFADADLPGVCASSQ